jgi:hypothetical protein
MSDKQLKMSDEQVRELAERIVSSRDPNRHDAFMLAEAWLAENPEDSDTLVDVEWMATCKAISHDENSRYWWTIESCVRFKIRDEGIELWVDGYLITANPTRGDVRRLARALRVELGEKR